MSVPIDLKLKPDVVMSKIESLNVWDALVF